MARKIDINWKEVREFASRTNENVTEFELARKNLQEITISLNECWQGKDAESFTVSLLNYLDSLKEDTTYLLKWYSCLKRSANRYNSGVEEGLQKVKNLQESFILYNQSSSDQIRKVNSHE